MQANGIKLVRQREHNMVVFNRQGGLQQVVNPECLSGSLKF
jgi:hypothetical protein